MTASPNYPSTSPVLTKDGLIAAGYCQRGDCEELCEAGQDYCTDHR